MSIPAPHDRATPRSRLGTYPVGHSLPGPWPLRGGMPLTVLLTCSSAFTVRTVTQPESEGLSAGTKSLKQHSGGSPSQSYREYVPGPTVVVENGSASTATLNPPTMSRDERVVTFEENSCQVVFDGVFDVCDRPDLAVRRGDPDT